MQPTAPDSLRFAARDLCRKHTISYRDIAAASGQRISKSAVGKLFADGCTVEHFESYWPVFVEAVRSLLSSCRSPEKAARDFAELLSDPEEETFMNRCILTPDACRFHGLAFDPFDIDRLPVGDELFRNKELDSIAARLVDAVRYQRFVSVIGDVGTGKTLLKLRLEAELERIGGCRLIYPEFFDMSQVTVGGIASLILTELGQKVPRDKTQRASRVRRVLADMLAEGTSVALVLDECHRLDDSVISALKNFWELTNGRTSRVLGIILFGQPSFVEARLRDVRFREIKQRVQVIEMPELKRSAASYLEHKLSVAGGDLKKLFEDAAVKKLCKYADTPLAIGNLANEALMEAYRQEEKQVSASFRLFTELDRQNAAVRSIRKAA